MRSLKRSWDKSEFRKEMKLMYILDLYNLGDNRGYMSSSPPDVILRMGFLDSQNKAIQVPKRGVKGNLSPGFDPSFTYIDIRLSLDIHS